ncbi:Piso0_000968 [Millerozyma farinosa CBS 7064]|uniref:Piso0_000968 protein n=1 Tax=Pichia sorbitophila (strain ATCC MYA-4447 / BCRC 22081 / CBS 7064 / NBRC 10061 / NRRL Y-12695) TaxID=559304 RepID=G8YQJ8_PICSO|nr:Piso0_000968 [Millerozyma farinosa CBS 7064]CCE78933.1 Piso0_000968 [Millerozyma farinosa CBS 7064]
MKKKSRTMDEYNDSSDSLMESIMVDGEDYNMHLDELLPDNLYERDNTNYEANVLDESFSDCAIPMGSPSKKVATWRPVNSAGTTLESLQASANILKPENTNPVADELFQVTKKFRKEPTSSNIFGLNGLDEDGWLFGKKLNNDKIDKLVQNLNMDEESEESFELDDKNRTRVFKGRFHNREGCDMLDMQINDYLKDKENKVPENALHNTKGYESNGIKKSKRLFFKNPKKKLPSAPALKPLVNLTNVELKKHESKMSDMGLGVNPMNIAHRKTCVPKHTQGIRPRRPSLSYRKLQPNIYLVDSSTGHLNDATQFATELNASNCEGFPLPEDTNEIVQIPTNEEVISAKSKRQNAAAHKMAIIKAFRNKYFNTENLQNDATELKLGFYNKEEYEMYMQNQSLASGSGVAIASQSEGDISLKNNKDDQKKKKQVRWADSLEW